jgi:hypothetical protein
VPEITTDSIFGLSTAPEMTNQLMPVVRNPLMMPGIMTDLIVGS